MYDIAKIDKVIGELQDIIKEADRQIVLQEDLREFAFKRIDELKKKKEELLEESE